MEAVSDLSFAGTRFPIAVAPHKFSSEGVELVRAVCQVMPSWTVEWLCNRVGFLETEVEFHPQVSSDNITCL